MKESSESIPITGLTQSSTPILKFMFERVKPVQLLGEV